MKTKSAPAAADPEILAISEVYSAVRGLEKDAQIRVFEYVSRKLGHPHDLSTPLSRVDKTEPSSQLSPAEPADEETATLAAGDDLWDGVSPVARKWVQRNDLNQKFLSSIFSIGGEEIDLVARNIPGKSKRQRMREVILLKGIAAYLSGGVARISHETVKEACSHYDALDTPNFAKNMKEFASEVSGAKESGYTLSPRGLASGAELIKQMASQVTQ